MISTSRLVAFASFLAFVSPLAAAIKFTPLGKLTGGTYAYVKGLSSDGTTVIGYGSTTAASQEAFRGTLAGLTGLGDLPGGPATPDSKANAVSSDGSVVVGYGTTTQGQEAFRWTSTTGLVSLGRLPGSIYGSEAFGLSADGSVIVGVAYNASQFSEPFRWTSGGGLVSLGFMPGGNQGFATGVSADGSVVVGYGSTTGSFTAAFRWTQAGGMIYLGDLPGGSVASKANAVSGDGNSVVGYGRTDDGQVAMRWTQADGMVSLGYLPSNFIQSEALAVSADGSIVVGTSATSTGPRAFIWDAINGLRSIQDILSTAGKGSGWTVNYATGISANGKIVTGYGTSPSGQSEGWILDLDAPPPPPPSVALVWTEDLPQSVPGMGDSVVRLGYDNGTIGEDIATQLVANGGFNGVEYANGLILVPNQGAGSGTRTHAARYAPLLVTNLKAYDLDATPGLFWQANGSGTRIFKLAPSGGFTINGSVIDRTFTTLINRNVSKFTNAVQHSDASVYFSSSITNPIGIYKRSPELLLDQVTVHTSGSPSVYDFEVVGDQIYFGDINTNTIQRVKTDGTGLVTLVTDATFVNGIDVTDTYIYWSEFTTGLIRRANLDGSNPVTLIEGRSGLRGVAVVPLSLTTGPAPQAVAISGLAPTYTDPVNTPVTLTPVATSGLPVSLEIVSGPATLNGNAISYTDAGTVHVRGTQAGNASFASATFDYFVTSSPPAAQTIDFPQPANVSYTGTPVVFTPAATATSGLAVSFTVVLGPATYDPVGGTITVTGTGTITLRAEQSGGASYAAAAPVERTFISSGTGGDTLADFLTNAGVPANLRGPNDDADNDGFDNLLEYALDLNPNGNGGGSFTGSAPTLTSSPTLLQLTYRRVATDVTYVVESTTDLISGSWTTVGVTQGTPGPDGTTTASIPVTPGSQFMRLSVTR